MRIGELNVESILYWMQTDFTSTEKILELSQNYADYLRSYLHTMQNPQLNWRVFKQTLLEITNAI